MEGSSAVNGPAPIAGCVWPRTSPQTEELHLPRHCEVCLVPPHFIDHDGPHVPVDDPRPPYRLLEVLDVLGPVVGVADPAIREIPPHVNNLDVTGPYPCTRAPVGALRE